MEDKFIGRCPALARLRNGFVAACEIPAIKEGHRAWIGVYPLHANEHHRAKGDYRVRIFEVEEKHLLNDSDVWDEVMESRGDFCVVGESALLARVEEFVDPFCLGEPRDCDYPV